jgi:hypothetical protein
MVLLFCLTSAIAGAQLRTRTLSVLNYPNDARTVAMGGDGAGSLDGHSVLFSQYQLPEEQYFQNSISFRPPNWNNTENISFLQASVFRNLGGNTGIGVNFYGNISARAIGYGEDSPIFLGNVQEYQILLQGYYRTEIVQDFSVGAGLKYYSASNNFVTVIIGSPTKGRIDGSALLLDVGGAWKRPLSDSPGSGTTYVVVSISNLGTPIVYDEDLKFRVPRSLHGEVGYTQEFGDALISHVQGSFHYRNVLNSYNADNKIFWIMGGEAVVRNVFFVRSGWYIAPYSTIFGGKGKPVFTFGAGILLSGKTFRLGEVNCKIDYAFVPINSGMYPQHNMTRAEGNHVLTVSVITP